jgi:N-methylhydantoinase A/oxoprolinase/acetone carboxylase beta subunit
MVDVHTIGAGGGSIAFLDPAGGLKVGPESAGARPGPACYGFGGRDATVTDATMVLGYLNPATYAGGGFALYPDLASEAVASRIARPLGLDLVHAASGIHEIVNTQMAEAVRLVSVRRGYDLRGIALVAMGGAGPIHAGRLLDLLGAQAVVVPSRPGVGSAYGLLMADIRHEFSRAYPRRLAEASPQELAALFEDIDARGRARMRTDGVAESDVAVQRFAEMRYVGQSYELDIAVPTDGFSTTTLQTLRQRFHQAHDRVYGHHSPSNEIEFISVRGVHAYRLPAPPVERGLPSGRAWGPAARRSAYFRELQEYRDTPVYERFTLPTGAVIQGPAILDQDDTTTVVYPGQEACIHDSGNVVITRADRPDGASV